MHIALSIVRPRRNANLPVREMITPRSNLVIMTGFISSTFSCVKDEDLG